MQHVFIDNEFIPESDAKISIKDRGFKYGDGVFETIAIYEGIPYQWELHILRLSDSLSYLGFSFDTQNLYENGMELIKKNAIKNGILRITITRGIGGHGYLIPDKSENTALMETITDYTKNEDYVRLWVSKIRKVHPSAIPSHIKTLSGISSVLARKEAKENGCFEALLLGNDNQICECSSGNIFWFKGDILYTPSLDSGILRGTTRDAVIRITPFKVVEDIFSLNDIKNADEVFITNVTWQVTPVKELLPIGKIWKEFPKSTEIYELLRKDIAEYVITRNSSMG